VAGGWFIRCMSASVVGTKLSFEVTALLLVEVMEDEMGFVLAHD